MMRSLKNILFLDIETVSNTYDYDQLSERLKTQWSRKAAYIKKEASTTDQEVYEQRSGIYAEFGKVITIAVGYFVKTTEGDLSLRIKVFADKDEKKLLLAFNQLLDQYKATDLQLCAHNGKEFDFPYLCRRMLVQGIPLPYVLNTSGKKPWEVNHLDTMEMWKFGDWKHYTSLELLAEIFGIESSKTDIDGSKVNAAFHLDNALDKIAKYCMRDVAVLAQLYLRLNSIHDFDANRIDYIS